MDRGFEDSFADKGGVLPRDDRFAPMAADDFVVGVICFVEFGASDRGKLIAGWANEGSADGGGGRGVES